MGLPLSVTQGTLSGTDRTVPIDNYTRHNLIQTDAAVNPGNSGGPLLSIKSGRVVGLVDLGAEQAHGLGFAVSSKTALKELVLTTRFGGPSTSSCRRGRSASTSQGACSELVAGLLPRRRLWLRFVVSVAGVGYEQKAYLWIGYGVWTQLWASLTLPLAWGLSWRAIRSGTHFFAPVLLGSLTLALHFETGYLAILPLLLWPLAAGAPLWLRFRRAALLLGGVLLASSWVIVPLIAQRPWAAVNEVLSRTPLANGYGAPQMLSWLVSGRLLDYGRLPVLSVLAGLGVGLVAVRWRRDAGGRALVVALVACLLLSLDEPPSDRWSTSFPAVVTSSFAGS